VTAAHVRAVQAAALGLMVTAAGAGSAAAQVAMPDPSLIHGKALPAGELAAGTVTVRVVREAIGNNIVGQSVTLVVDGASRTATTDEMGRAEFTGLAQGGAVRAEAIVDGEALASDSFTVPASGGLRVILVAGLEAAKARAAERAAADAAAPPVAGTVVLGPNSRIVLEFQDDALRMFYVLDILNNARARVDIGGPLIIDLPEGAGGAAVLQGSSPNATVSGDRLTVTGPFAAGVTPVQVGFQLRYTRSDIEVQQRWPVAMEQLTVAAQKLGTLAISSPQLTTVGEVKSEAGTPFLLGSGPALPAGSTLTLQLSNLPVHSQIPRVVALTLALGILAVGAWAGFSARPKSHSRAQLTHRRDELLAELAAIDRRERSGTPSARDRQRRPEVMAELERLYGELDDASADVRGGGGDVAA
jgi:hypothetical protein